MRIPIQDLEREDILIWLPHACQFIDEALRTGGVILVHGVYGLSRGATVIAAYLMWSRRITPAAALDSVRRVREQIWPNAGFQEQLSIFEMCRYAPSMNEGIYARWRQNLDRRVQGGSAR
ncbi:hypothetical protein EWM64_g4701 [Hericium alpestre]|uniref:Uncharacterized protein n=1 Tax=Hericium alpestre TaxID=135208 RepID=A0A4Y9ZXK0_9AGAM|nr:hypothetical protein EWM64_g4701 [Hericium alpestre]